MNILSINQKYEVNGGSDRYYFNLNELLREKGHDIYDFAAKGGLDLNSKFSEYFPDQVKFDLAKPKNFFSYLYNFDAKNSLSRLMENIPLPDLAHLQIYYGQLTVSILDELKSRQVPVIQTLHEYKLSCPVYTHINNEMVCHSCNDNGAFSCVSNRCKDGSVVKSLVRYLEFTFSKWKGDRELVDQFVCVSNFQRDLMIRAGVPSEKLNVIYNFVQAKNIPFSTDNSGYYFYFGRLEKLKGLATLLEVAKSMPKIGFVIAGEGPYKEELIRFISSQELKNVEFVGFKQGDDLWKLVKDSKAVLVPSEWYENCSMTVLEAKAYCKPVIASAIGGITEQIIDGENGFLHEPANVNSFVAAIDRLEALSLQDYEAMCLRSREDLDLRYSADVHYRKLMEVYRKVT